MWIDYHTHILPAMDDGARDVAQADAMLHLLRKQEVAEVVLTPHYYADRETVEEFLKRRAAAYFSLITCDEGKRMPLRLGAEVRLERNMCRMDALPQLCIEGTRFLLLELPYAPFEPWMMREIENIAYRLRVTPILAHLDRYLTMGWLTREEWEELIGFGDAVVQINAEAFEERALRRPLKELLDSDVPVVFGTDAHDMQDRAPNGHLLKKALRHYVPPVLW